MNAISAAGLALWQRAGFAHTLLDVRRAEKRTADGDATPGSAWLDPARWLDWKDGVATDRPAVIVRAHGHDISQGLTAALCALGVDARRLGGGIAAWRAAELPLEPLGGSAA